MFSFATKSEAIDSDFSNSYGSGNTNNIMKISFTLLHHYLIITFIKYQTISLNLVFRLTYTLLLATLVINNCFCQFQILMIISDLGIISIEQMCTCIKLYDEKKEMNSLIKC